MSAELETVCTRALNALCNGTYQGLLLTLAVALTLAFCRRVNATTRYAIRFLALLVVAILPIAHFFIVRPASANPVAPRGEPVPDTILELEAAPEPAPAKAEDLRRLQALILAFQSEPTLTEPLDPAAPEPAATDPTPPVESDTELGASPLPAAIAGNSGEDDAGAGPTDGLASAPPLPATSWRPALPAGASVVLVGIWFVIAATRLLFLFGQYIVLLRLKRKAQPGTPMRKAQLDLLRTEMGLQGSVDLRHSGEVTAPIVTGLARPTIVLPLTMVEAPEADMERVLRHELAHLRRRDDWTNLLQQMARAVFFYHPAVLWLSRRLTVDREIACDDHVLSATRSRRDYALFLTDFASRTLGRQWAAAPAAWSRKSQLKERIDMILDTKRNASTRLSPARVGFLTTAVTVLAGLAIVAGPRLALADEPAPLKNPPGGLSLTVTTDDNASSSITTGEVKWKDQPPTPTTDPEAGAPEPAKLPRAPRAPRSVVAITALPSPAVEAAPVVVIGDGEQEGNVNLAPPQPGRPRTDRRPDDLERRLSRLERMVESLVKKDGPPDERPEPREHGEDAKGKLKREIKVLAEVNKEDMKKQAFAFKGFADGFKNQAMEWQKNFNFTPGSPGYEQLTQALEQAKREVERATQEAARAIQEATRSADIHKHIAVDIHAENKPGENQRRRLGEQRRNLQKQIEQIEARLDKLDSQLDQVEEIEERAADQQEERAEAARERAREDREHAREEREHKEPAKDKGYQGKEKGSDDNHPGPAR